MRGLFGGHAVVVGAGIGGLTAAKALSSFFENVTILERDALPNSPEARAGTPQARHVHALLKGGLDALEGFFPGFEAALESAGAARVRLGSELRLEAPGFDPFPKRDLGFDIYFMSRPLVEFVARKFVAGVKGVSLLDRTRAVELIRSADGASVAGVRYERAGDAPQPLAADLVVDASSRGALTRDFLETIEGANPDETEIGVDLCYATAIFETSPAQDRDWLAVIHRADAGSGRGAFLFPIEHNRWHVNLNGVHGDQPPSDLPGFIAFAKTLRTPTVYAAIKRAVPVGPIYRFALPSSTRRRFEMLATFPAGLIPLGDAICRTNPAFGLGMSVAAQEAAVLARLLRERAMAAKSLEGLALDYFSAIQSILAVPWSAAENDFVFEKTRGVRPSDFSQRLKYSLALQRLGAEDPAVHRLMTEVNHLLKPTAALRDPAIASQVTARMGTA